MAVRKKDRDGVEIADEPAWTYDAEILLELPGSDKGYRKGQKENARALKFMRLFGDALVEPEDAL